MTAAAAEPVLEDVAAPGGRDPSVGDWQKDKQGREYIPAKGRRGLVYRQGDETVAAALARDAQPPGDRRPRKKGKAKTPPPPAAPESADLKELEKAIADALKSPAIVCAAFGDRWAADHFTKMGPHVARNLVATAQHNQWLRRKLEAWATGGDLPMQLFALLGLGGSFALYLVPPVIYFFNLPVPDQAREMLDIPPRRLPEPDPYADTPFEPPAEADAARPEAA